MYFFAAGTTTPQSAYQDVALTIPWPNPIVLDAAGRIPAFYLADGQIKIRLADSSGVTQVAADNLLVIGASSGAGSPPSVDATTVLSTGDMKFKYGTGSITGWVRANGRTIGSGTSGGSERANSDAQTLFEYLWGADAALVVSTGRGGSANADWVANKTIALPDYRGRVPGCLDDMGNSAAGRLTATYFGTAATVIGAAGGAENTSITLVTANLPAYTPVGTIGGTGSLDSVGFNVAPGGSATALTASGGTPRSITLTGATFTGTAQGGTSTAILKNIAQPTMLATFYLKL